MSKYGNKKISVDGIVFDSKREAHRYMELRLLLKAGAIRDLQRQVKYVLIPSQYEDVAKSGKKKRQCIERECAYYADFQYIDALTGKTVVEDTKGMKTKDYIIKRKLMLYTFGIRVKEI